MQVTLSFFYNLNFRFVSMGCCDICWILYDKFLDISLLQSSSRNWRSFLFNHRTSNHCRPVHQRFQIKGFGLFLFCHPCRNWSWIRSRLKCCCRSFRLEMGFTRYSFYGPGCPFIDCVCYDCENNRQKKSYAMDNLVVVIFIIVVLLLLLSFISLLGAVVFIFVMKMKVSFTHSTNLLFVHAIFSDWEHFSATSVQLNWQKCTIS